MLVYEFSIDQPVSYHFTGKFKSPEPQWKHDELPLDDYEIILVTDGTLYLQYLDHKYEVRKGEVLLLPLPLPDAARVTVRLTVPFTGFILSVPVQFPVRKWTVLCSFRVPP